ncbi:site-2 protease family protein [Yinghuangia seranimata]|uniref:site-2 protease family protein n=1 Tax=Yinghuangia seranimata TaxID=408067 RepID=UPI00248BF866|nr:site-2 protease family protein [Yinghuangia seranimata]MDI2125469.1 site-2 protease family protein [Yinghuangia seranimata]
MRATFRLGRILGVRVGVHWSVAVIFGVIAIGLARSRLPDAHPGHSTEAYWTVGLLTAAVFFGCLLAHELAHAVVARRNGVDVDDIVLWLLGGVARLRGEAATPGAELRIAGVGPLVSLLLGGVFALGAWTADTASGAGLAVDALVWLAVINVALAVFNAIPAAPLDGGRLLRALLWWRTGDRLRATTGAATAGRAFGWLLVALGLFLFIRGTTFSGLWLAAIGWFLVAAATMEARQAEVRATLGQIPVRNAMTREPVTVPDSATVAEFLLGDAYRYRHSAYPVTDQAGAPLGLLTLHAAQHVPEYRRGAVTVGAVMLPLAQVAVVGPDEPLRDLLPRLEPGPEHRVLVIDEGRLLGVLSGSDVTRMVTWLTTTDPRRRGS